MAARNKNLAFSAEDFVVLRSMKLTKWEKEAQNNTGEVEKRNENFPKRVGVCLALKWRITEKYSLLFTAGV